MWHGSDTRGVRNSGKFCGAWRSDSVKDTGMASPLTKHMLLGQQDFTCNRTFAVLCIEAIVVIFMANMSKINVQKRLEDKRRLVSRRQRDKVSSSSENLAESLAELSSDSKKSS
uniref:Collagenase NC10/endostatin domain-containing protein n=1 Tax=Romanomermis culicivorax TaxID=13658 RepID=A0A915IBC0_ROMCU